jgi:hypothetical protein
VIIAAMAKTATTSSTSNSVISRHPPTDHRRAAARPSDPRLAERSGSHLMKDVEFTGPKRSKYWAGSGFAERPCALFASQRRAI